MPTSLILDTTLNQDAFTLTNPVNNATAFYLNTPDTEFELEVDVFLQIEISNIENRQLRLFEGLNITNTEQVLPIPKEYQNINLPKYFAFYSDIAVRLQCFAISPDSCDCKPQLDEIQNQLGLIQFASTATAINQLAQNAALTALSAGLGGVLAPLTAGASLAIPAAVTPPLTAGSTTLIGLPGI